MFKILSSPLSNTANLMDWGQQQSQGMMKRRRGRAKSLTSYSDQLHMAASPSDGALRRSRRSSLQMNSRLLPFGSSGIKTRASSRAGSTSPAQSIMSVDSRRSSVNGAPIGGSDIDADRPAKRKRHSEPISPSPENSSASSQRMSQDSPEKVNGQQEDQQDPEVLPEIEVDEPSNAGTLDPAESIHDEERDIGKLTELTAAIVPRRRGRRPKRFRAETPVESAFGTPAPGTPYNGLDGGTGVNTDQEQTKVVKRLPGRRRAPNANVNIEADLRRQLILKTSYRSVAKALKPILAELARRSTNELREDPEAHTRCEEYEVVTAQLRQRLQRRLAEVEARFYHETNLLEKSQDQGKEYANMKFGAYLESLQDDYQVKADFRSLELRRQAEKEMDEDLTDNENGIVPPLYGKISLEAPTGQLEKKFDSRSRFFLETERLTKQKLRRLEISRELDQTIEEHMDDFDEDPRKLATGLGTIDSSRRELAIQLLNIHTLASAAERQSFQDKEALKPLILPNEEADGLQALLEAVDIQSKVIPYLVPRPNPAPAYDTASFAPDSGPVQYHSFPPRPIEDAPVTPKHATLHSVILPTITESSPTAHNFGTNAFPSIQSPTFHRSGQQDARNHSRQMQISHILSTEDSESQTPDKNNEKVGAEMPHSHGRNEWSHQSGNTPAEYEKLNAPTTVVQSHFTGQSVSPDTQSIDPNLNRQYADTHPLISEYPPGEENGTTAMTHHPRGPPGEQPVVVSKTEEIKSVRIKKVRPRAATMSAIPQSGGYSFKSDPRYEHWEHHPVHQNSSEGQRREDNAAHPVPVDRSPSSLPRSAEEGREGRRSSIAAPQQYTAAQLSSDTQPMPPGPPAFYSQPPPQYAPQPVYPGPPPPPPPDSRYPPYSSPTQNGQQQWPPQQWDNRGYHPPPPQAPEGHLQYAPPQPAPLIPPPPPPPPAPSAAYPQYPPHSRDAQYGGPPMMAPPSSYSGPPPPLPSDYHHRYNEQPQDQREYRPAYGGPNEHSEQSPHPVRDNRDYQRDREHPGWEGREYPPRDEHSGRSPPAYYHEVNSYDKRDGDTPQSTRGNGPGRPRRARGRARRGYRGSYSPRGHSDGYER